MNKLNKLTRMACKRVRANDFAEQYARGERLTFAQGSCVVLCVLMLATLILQVIYRWFVVGA